MISINSLVSNNNCVANISEQIEESELSAGPTARFVINNIKNIPKEEVVIQAPKNKSSSLIKTLTKLAFLLGLSLVIAGISMSILMPVLISISIPLVILGFGVLFFSIISSLSQHVKKNHEQITQIQDTEKEKALIKKEEINELESEHQERLQAANKIKSLYKQRNERLLAKKENEFGVISAESSLCVDEDEKGLIKRKEDDHVIDYSNSKKYRRYNNIQSQRLYLKSTVKEAVNQRESCHPNKVEHRLRFVGKVPNMAINNKYKKGYEKIFLGTEDEVGMFKRVLLRDDQFAILYSKNNGIEINNYFINESLSPYDSVTPLTKYEHSQFETDAVKIITPYRGITLDKLVAKNSFKLFEFEPLLADIKKMYKNGIYVSDIKMGNIAIKKVKGINKISLIDVDAFFSKDIKTTVITYNIYYYPKNLVENYQIQKLNNMDNKLMKGRLPHWDALLNLETYALLQLLFDLHRGKEKEEVEILENDIHGMKHTDTYIKAFNSWVDLAVLPSKRDAVKKFILDPKNHPIDTHAHDLIDFYGNGFSLKF